MCAICNRRHGVQVHHIMLRSSGGSNDASNAIPLCPNCHTEVHAGYAPGKTTRKYTEQELRLHLARTEKLANQQTRLVRGNDDWNHDLELVEFYASCLDRPAFRMHFHNELSFADFDQALEDTVLALSTGLWRTRDGVLIERSEGKRKLVNAEWREKVDAVVSSVNSARTTLRRDLGLDRMLMSADPYDHGLDRYASRFRSDRALATEMDNFRQQALDLMNEVLEEADLPKLKRSGEWS